MIIFAQLDQLDTLLIANSDIKKILVICTGNSCRSIILEAIINHFGGDYFRAFSAGSNPTGFVHPMSIKTLKNNGVSILNPQSKSWDIFNEINFDLVITVCNSAAGESCPIYLNNSPKTHWGVSDPAKFQGTNTEIEEYFQKVFSTLKIRTEAFIENYKDSHQIDLNILKNISYLS